MTFQTSYKPNIWKVTGHNLHPESGSGTTIFQGSISGDGGYGCLWWWSSKHPRVSRTRKVGQEPNVPQGSNWRWKKGVSLPVDNPDILLGVPKRIGLLSNFEFLSLGGVFLGVKNNSKNSGTKKNIGLYSKILSKWAFFIRKM